MTYPEALLIESVDHEARGVARHEGKVIFVDGALPGERVIASPYRRRAKFDNAQISSIVAASPARVTPRCAHYGICGGCSMQHADLATQVAIKQRVLEDNLAHIGRVVPEVMLRPIVGPAWEYRYRARLSMRHVPSKGRGAGWFSRTQEKLCGRHARLPCAAAPHRQPACPLA